MVPLVLQSQSAIAGISLKNRIFETEELSLPILATLFNSSEKTLVWGRKERKIRRRKKRRGKKNRKRKKERKGKKKRKKEDREENDEKEKKEGERED